MDGCQNPFNTIGEEHMLNELFYAIKNSDIYNKGRITLLNCMKSRIKNGLKLTLST